MVVVAGDVTGVAAVDLDGKTAKGVPDRRPAPVLLDRALDLVGRRRGAPQKPVWKMRRHRRPHRFLRVSEMMPGSAALITPAADPPVHHPCARKASAGELSMICVPLPRRIARHPAGSRIAAAGSRPDSDIQRSRSHEVTAISRRSDDPATGAATPSADQGISASAVMRG